MTGFLVAAVVLTACTLICVLPALLRGENSPSRRVRRDELNLAVLQDQSRELDADLAAGAISAASHLDARGELARCVARDTRAAVHKDARGPNRVLAFGITLALPAFAVALYFHVGAPGGVHASSAGAVAAVEGHDIGDAEITVMVRGLAERLESTPDDAEGWYMLARSYSALGRFADAAQAYAKVEKLLPADADVLVDFADALATSQGASLTGKPERLVARALDIDPNNVKALALAGSAAFERGAYAQAEAQWRKLLPLVPPESDFARSTLASIAQATARAGGKPIAAPAAEHASSLVDTLTPAHPTAARRQAADAKGLSGTVELAPELRDKASPDDDVFIFARGVDGPPFPLAVLRKKVSDLPLRFTLDDSMSMVAGANLSSSPWVTVGARISKAGIATPTAGDLEGQAGPVKPDAQSISIRIVTERK